MSTGWSEGARGGGCCFRRTISTISGDERRSNSFIMITWLKWDSFTTKFRQCSWDRQAGQVGGVRPQPQQGTRPDKGLAAMGRVGYSIP